MSPILRNGAPRRWAIVISLVFGAAGILVPGALQRAYQMWMMFGAVLGGINSRVILTVFYYVLVTPISCLISLAKHDPLNRRFDRTVETYRVRRSPRAVTHMDHQF
jgi:hypothetical protein